MSEIFPPGFQWHEVKNQTNIKNHGIDFHDAVKVFEKPTLDRTDNRQDYKETRTNSIGELNGKTIVNVTHTDRDGETRLISARLAKERERQAYKEFLKEMDQPEASKPAAAAAPPSTQKVSEPPSTRYSASTPETTSAKPLVEPAPGDTAGIARRVVKGSAAAEAAGGLTSSAAAGTIAVGSVERASGVALKAAGRALGPLGLAVNAATLEAAYDADGKKIGAHTGRAASGVAGGWAGAVAGAEGGAVVGAAAGSVVPVVGTAAGATAGGVVGAVAGGVTGDWVGRRMFDRVKGMFGSPAESEAPTASPKPEAAPKAPGGIPIAGAGAASTSDVGAGTAVAWANSAAVAPSRAVEAIRAREVEARAMWHASATAKPAAQGIDAMTAAGVGVTASARSEAGATGLAQSGAGASTVSAVDGRAHWSSLGKEAAAASGGAGITAGPSDEGRAVVPGRQAPGSESLASASASEAAVAPGRSLRLRS